MPLTAIIYFPEHRCVEVSVYVFLVRRPNTTHQAAVNLYINIPNAVSLPQEYLILSCARHRFNIVNAFATLNHCFGGALRVFGCHRHIPIPIVFNSMPSTTGRNTMFTFRCYFQWPICLFVCCHEAVGKAVSFRLADRRRLVAFPRQDDHPCESARFE